MRVIILTGSILLSWLGFWFAGYDYGKVAMIDRLTSRSAPQSIVIDRTPPTPPPPATTPLQGVEMAVNSLGEPIGPINAETCAAAFQHICEPGQRVIIVQLCWNHVDAWPISKDGICHDSDNPRNRKESKP